MTLHRQRAEKLIIVINILQVVQIILNILNLNNRPSPQDS